MVHFTIFVLPKTTSLHFIVIRKIRFKKNLNAPPRIHRSAVNLYAECDALSSSLLLSSGFLTLRVFFPYRCRQVLLMEELLGLCKLKSSVLTCSM